MGTSGSTSASYTEGRAASDMDSTSQNDGCVFERKKNPSPFFWPSTIYVQTNGFIRSKSNGDQTRGSTIDGTEGWRALKRTGCHLPPPTTRERQKTPGVAIHLNGNNLGLRLLLASYFHAHGRDSQQPIRRAYRAQ